jgi:hypothetical protein
MSTDKLYKRIESSGAQGIRRVKLRKEFGAKTGKNIDELLSKSMIFAEKKGGAITYWSKDNYTQHLLASDPKFKLIFDMYSNANDTISDTISKINRNLNKKVSNITTTIQQQKDNGNGNGDYNGMKLTLDQFRMEFDRTLTEIPTSIGWVEMSLIRERICDKYSISKQNFYSLASQLFDQFNNKYELSSGGNEGVMVRGLVHGFVRCI